MTALQSFFYDAQIERFLVQFIRMMSGFQVQYGENEQGVKTLQRVPVYYGDSSRQVAQIIANNSESTTPVVPAMTVYINNLVYDRSRIQEPNFVSKMSLRQREYNEDTGEYEQRQGNAFTIERIMPVPYELELKLDIWTSNTRQKLQLVEQIDVMFNPGLEIQSTDNYIDWTSLSVVYLDGQTWTSRSVPIGTDNPIDVVTMTFKLPIWLSPPAKIKQLGVIQKIVSNIHDSSGDLSSAILNDANLLGQRQYFTPLDYGVLLVGNTLTLLKVQDIGIPRDPTLDTPTKLGTKDAWKNLINVYGVLREGTSQIRLWSNNFQTEVVGTVSYDPNDESLLIFNADIDTYPANTLANINAIIDPRKTNVDSSITNPATGTRYLILNDIGSYDNPVGFGAPAWTGTNGIELVANTNDIIEYNGTHWVIAFDSSQSSTVEYVSNLNTGTQYRWSNNQWIKSFEGEYKNGEWSLVL